jgi:hypothetical protein
MADRARRHQRHVRARDGATGIAERLLDGRPPVVQRGLFAGLRYPSGRTGDIDAPAAKLLGTYEQELTTVFEDALQRVTRTFVDIGCADGYYAVGMPFISPGLTTHAFDIARSARELCAEVAAVNDVAARVRIKGRFSAESLAGLDVNGALMLCDVEGAEAALFDEALVSRLRHTFVVIEVHEHVKPGLSGHLQSVFASSHDHRVMVQDKRRPQDFAELPLSARELATALGENRPRDLHWLVLDPRSPDAQR